jgi:hypothetical protein
VIDVQSCKECAHYEPCFDYGNILDPAHGGVKCDSFKSSADVVEVVRCKDCDHFLPCEDYPEVEGYCVELMRGMYGEGFCCFAKRREQ